MLATGKYIGQTFFFARKGQIAISLDPVNKPHPEAIRTAKGNSSTKAFPVPAADSLFSLFLPEGSLWLWQGNNTSRH